MIDNLTEAQAAVRGTTLARLRQDLLRCITRAETLGLTAIAIYLQRAVDELDDISG